MQKFDKLLEILRKLDIAGIKIVPIPELAHDSTPTLWVDYKTFDRIHKALNVKTEKP